MKERLRNILNTKKRLRGAVAFAVIALITIAGAALIAFNQTASAKTPALDETITASSSGEAARLFSEAVMQKDIRYFEDDCGINITDETIDSVTLMQTFEDLTDGTVYLYELQYRIKPENLDEVVMAGGMQMEDGWLTETAYGNFPLLLERDGEYSLIRNMNGQSFQGLEGNRQFAVMWEIDQSGRFALSPNAGCDIVRNTLIAAVEAYFEGSSYMPEINVRESRVYGFDWSDDPFTVEFTAELAAEDDGVFPQGPLVFRYIETDGAFDLTSLAEQLEVRSNYPAASVPYYIVYHAQNEVAERLCVAQRWAEAVKGRDGRAQYELLCASRQEEELIEYESRGWVTGTSSPWVEDYDIESTDGGAVITYKYATFTGFAGYYEQRLTFIEEYGELRITGFSRPKLP